MPWLILQIDYSVIFMATRYSEKMKVVSYKSLVRGSPRESEGHNAYENYS
jgi:hypothetical protein